MTELFAREIKRVFEEIARSRSRSGDTEVAFTVLCPDKGGSLQRVSGMVTFAHGHWTPEPSSAILRVEDLLVKTPSGTGTVDFVIVLMPIRPTPQISENGIDVNGVNKFQGANLQDFLKDFLTEYIREWNK